MTIRSASRALARLLACETRREGEQIGDATFGRQQRHDAATDAVSV
jgi:hypothetical protein